MSIHAQSPGETAPLLEILQHAGGVLTQRDGCSVVVNYGSAAGELAACVRAVGLADCSQLVKLVLEGPDGYLGELVEHMTGVAPAPGGAVFAGGGWWCADHPGRVIVLIDPRPGLRLKAQLLAALQRYSAVSLSDHSAKWAALAVIGHRARPLLAELGVYGEPADPRQVPPLTRRPIAGVDVLWLLESDHRALALVPATAASAVWRTIDQAGQPFGICAVGSDAVARYALIRDAHTAL